MNTHLLSSETTSVNDDHLCAIRILCARRAKATFGVVQPIIVEVREEGLLGASHAVVPTPIGPRFFERFNEAAGTLVQNVTYFGIRGLPNFEEAIRHDSLSGLGDFILREAHMLVRISLIAGALGISFTSRVTECIM